MKRYFFLFAFFCWLSSPGSLAAQVLNPEEETTAFDLLYKADGLPEIDLEVDLDQVLANRKNDDRVEGVLSFTDQAGQSRSWTAGISVRGRFRRLRCDFPPLKVDLEKKELKQTGLEKHDEFKLVTHCQNDWLGEDLVIREYLAYRIYNLLTDHSFRAQIARVNYHNSADGKVTTHYGIFVEDNKELAGRLEATICQGCFAPNPDSLDPDLTSLHDLFQLMIGNSDWSNQMVTNMEQFYPKNGGKGFFVPYDFDFSGFVNANYAVPDKKHGITNVRERVYLGFVYDAEVLKKTLSHLQSREADILQVIAGCPYASKASKKDMQNYIRSFFRKLEKLDLDNAESLQQSLVNWRN